MAAIEKLRDTPNTPKDPPPRVTRTKTRAQKAALEAIESKENQAVSSTFKLQLKIAIKEL